jgi:Protein of unknown function (DUF1091)
MDLNYLIIGTTVDFCQFMSGVKKNLVVQIIGQNINTSALSHLGCPVKKGLKASVKDILISDTFLPPLREEVRFRLEVKAFSKVEGAKNFKRSYDFNLYFRIKK